MCLDLDVLASVGFNQCIIAPTVCVLCCVRNVAIAMPYTHSGASGGSKDDAVQATWCKLCSVG
eukprot:7934035-Pyramimonas_sp.AAC.1